MRLVDFLSVGIVQSRPLLTSAEASSARSLSFRHLNDLLSVGENRIPWSPLELVLVVFPSGLYALSSDEEWVLWKHTGGHKKDPNAWKDSMKELCTFSTIEDFWRYFNHIPHPGKVFFDGESKRRVGLNNEIIEEYSLFKKGIEPEWGDTRNKSGGEWFWRSSMDGEVLDLFWQNIVFGVIGEMMEDPSMGFHINGARVVDKSKTYPIFKLELWLDTKDGVVKERIRSRLLETITHGLPANKAVKNNPRFEWKDHS